ncbi:MAG: stage 0 sporulation family protein [Clostridia bacterium]|nr:stage 0 sporulation family protein [Clostridia bacterium]
MNEQDKNIPQNENEIENEAAPKNVTVVGVNFRGAGKSYWFAPGGHKVSVGDKVIVETARGPEIGRITMAQKEVSNDDVVQPLRSVLRVATNDDLAREERNHKLEKDAAGIFRTKVASHKLEMNLVSVEYSFDNSKLLFYYTAENRVDFRELVKDLASVFKTRIELRQIGIRDEAKMVGGIGACGRPFCCSTFLSDFAQVSIKMAKEQNFSLNSAKISGTCGRLMCCLRYEHEIYEEAQKKLPHVGTTVQTPDGVGTVIETKPLAETVRVRLNGENKDAPKFYPAKDVTILRKEKTEESEQ